MLDRRLWIYPSARVLDMRNKLDTEQLYAVFNSQHHLQSATQLFKFLEKMPRKVCVVYGQKAQGKSQFLFFVFKLLHAIGEKVVFLDKSILPSEETDLIEVRKEDFCGNLWKSS